MSVGEIAILGAGMHPWGKFVGKSFVDLGVHAARTALKDADVAFGLSVKGAFTNEMMLTMNKNPIVFAMANPDPEINPDELQNIRPDAIIATGRSDYPNQVNNLIGFPYIFRGALDVRSKTIN